MKQYEFTVLIHPDLEMNLNPATDKIEKMIEDNGGKIIKVNNEGKKKLAYVINGQEFAVYHYYELELPATAPAKISAALNITDEVLRYLLVTVDEKKAKMALKRKANTSAETKETTEEE